MFCKIYLLDILYLNMYGVYYNKGVFHLCNIAVTKTEVTSSFGIPEIDLLASMFYKSWSSASAGNDRSANACIFTVILSRRANIKE